MTAIKIYQGKAETVSFDNLRKTLYWRQSEEAVAAGHPYVAVYQKVKFAKVTCDFITARAYAWRTAGKRFAELTAACAAQRYPHLKIDPTGMFTRIDRVPKEQADQLAADLARLAEAAMRETGVWPDDGDATDQEAQP